MSTAALSAAIGEHRYFAGLRDGSITTPEVRLEVAPIDRTLRNSMTRMVRDAAFDVCEMSPTSFLMARASGAPLVGLPIFPYRLFPFDLMIVREESPLRSPAEIGAARVGLRTWAQPTGLWLRHILSEHYGADLDRTQWTFVAEDPVATVRRPPGSVSRPDRTTYDLLATGEVDVAMGSSDVPDGCRQLIEDPESAARAWYAQARLVPANHMIVVREDVVDRVDVEALCSLFDAAQQQYLTSGRTDDPTIAHLRSVTGTGDPMPNGWEANREMWQVLVDAMLAQDMLAAAPDAGTVLPVEIP